MERREKERERERRKGERVREREERDTIFTIVAPKSSLWPFC